MPLIWTSDQLLTAARRKGMIGNSTARGTSDADLLEMVTESLIAEIAPEIMKIREEYYVRRLRIPLVANTSRYRIPSRAQANKLRDLWYADSGGNRKRLLPILYEELGQYNATGASEPSRYLIEENDIQLVPALGGATGSLEVAFYFRPSLLVPLTQARKITGVDLVTRNISFDTAVPSNWTGASFVDVHSPHSGAEAKLWDLDVGSVGGNQIIIGANTPIDGSVFGTKAAALDDWVCLAEECVIPMLPRDVMPVLVQATIIQLHLALGDHEAAEVEAQKFERMIGNLKHFLEGRVTGQPPKFKGRGGILNAMRGRR